MMKEAMFALKTHSNEYLSFLHGTIISVLLYLLQNADKKKKHHQQNKTENKQNTKNKTKINKKNMVTGIFQSPFSSLSQT